MPISDWPRRIGYWIPMACGSLAVLLAGAVMAGWFGRSPSLVQVLPSLVPMQFNNALSLGGGAAALLLCLRGRHRLAWLATAIPLFFGATALIQTYGAVDLHVDRLFVEPFTVVRSEFPGRMSVNSALAHLLTATALALLIVGARRRWALLPAAILAASVLGISINALFGYLAGVEIAYGWTRHSQMAVHTAAGLLLVSLGVFARAWLEGRTALGDSPAWVAMPVIVACLLPSVAVWQVLWHHEQRQVQRIVESEAAAIAQATRSELHRRLLALQRMGLRLGLNPGMPREQWEADALSYIADQPGYQALERIDRRGHVQWVVPARGNEAVVQWVAGYTEQRKDLLELARSTGSAVMTPPVALRHGGQGFLVYVPLATSSTEGRHFDGFLAAALRYADVLSHVRDVARLRGIDFALADGGRVVFRTASAPQDESRWGRSAPVMLSGSRWSVQVWPAGGQVSTLLSATPGLALVLSLLLTLLLGVTVHYGRSLRIHARSLVAGNERLTGEIAERRRAEENFRILVESTPNAIVMANAAGRIGFVNAQALHWFGYRREELLGQPVEVLVPCRLRDQHAADRAAYAVAPERRPMGSGRKLTGRRKDGSEFPVDISLAPVRTSDGEQVLAAITDMTEHIHVEQALRHSNDAMRAMNQELESFAYAVSHDLRQPLRAMGGFAQILQEDYTDRLDEQGRDYLARIQAAANRMGDLIDALLRLSRITRAPMERAPVDLTALAREIATQLEDGNPGRAVSWHIAEGMSAQGDREMLRVLLQNLLANAWKFTSHSEAAVIEVGQAHANGSAEFFVRDNGAGFDMSYADKLFGAFQRLHGPNEFPGTGIGLATAQRIVHRHGGRIWAEGVVGTGATFHFTV
jgi:PAS domain S-box-containing protein